MPVSTLVLPNGETSDAAAAAYVGHEDSMKDKVFNAILDVFVEIKTEIFKSLGLTETAKRFGLL